MLRLLVMVLGLAAGLVAGFLVPVVPSVSYARYLSIAVLASIDSAFGGLRAGLEGKYDQAVFLSGFFFNMVMAAGFIYVGDRLGVSDLYFAAVAAMGIRVFQNLGIIRRRLFERWGILAPSRDRGAPLGQ
ncbi:small basic family protein [Caldinitratiruptor microaerophilus]|uniref:Small basic protein n=1 Tax=Caldinitratiruptor microaerophilus TaxID=671077 RepID=A0AA35CK87_9FIRM|nr:small basic family protein [Caldinitratiruptor microaerophilus]BDG60752.1 hypothetical protein caldi_18420 [Caldinitratiruptor microaerophilus]